MKKQTVTVRATVESATPDRTQWKPYSTTLGFDGKLQIELEVPADQVVEQKGGVIVVTAAGWASMLKDYTMVIERMNADANREVFQPVYNKQ